MPQSRESDDERHVIETYVPKPITPAQQRRAIRAALAAAVLAKGDERPKGGW